MSAPETLNALKKLKVDCLYTKDTQFVAGQRVHREAHRFKTLLIIGTIVASFSTIMNVGIWDKIPDSKSFEILVNILGAFGGFLVLYATTFTGFSEKIEQASKHNSVGNSINMLYKKVRSTEAAFLDSLISDADLLKRLNEYTLEFTSLCKSAPITSPADFQKAKQNFDSGYLNYTQQELDI